MTPAEAAQAILDMDHITRRDFDAFLVGWLVAELKIGGTATVHTAVRDAIHAFQDMP